MSQHVHNDDGMIISFRVSKSRSNSLRLQVSLFKQYCFILSSVYRGWRLTGA